MKTAFDTGGAPMGFGGASLGGCGMADAQAADAEAGRGEFWLRGQTVQRM